jgi:cytochrome b pre-mRNA-processing protein 3
MLAKLFRRLTSDPAQGADRLFAMLTARAREAHWYLSGGVPDTIDGRFAVLASVTALAMVRLERDGASGDRLSAALTGRFAQVMDSEHRELGLGEPTLGKTVLKLVGSLAQRVALWRSLVPGSGDWTNAAIRSLSLDEAEVSTVAHSSAALTTLYNAFDRMSIEALAEGNME